MTGDRDRETGQRTRWRRFLGSTALALAIQLVAVAAVVTVPTAALGDQLQEIDGTLEDGTPFFIRKPANWNGIVITELDGRARRNNTVYQYLMAEGYGTAGTQRLGDRAWVTQQQDVERTLGALAEFTAAFGEPDMSIVHGRSAGGAVAMAAAELYPDVVDGATALCAVNVILVRNQIFDFFYTLRALLGPGDDTLKIDDFRPGTTGPASDRWMEVIEEAGETPEGRARIALAFAMSEYPVYGATTGTYGVPKPDFSDPDSVADAMVASALQIADRRIGNLLIFDADEAPSAAPDGTTRPQVYGNVGADYFDYWEITDPVYKGVTEALYSQAGLDLQSELEVVNNATRVEFDNAATSELLESQIETVRGLPVVPLFRMDNIGDQTMGPQAHQTYNDMVRRNGLQDLYRTSLVDRSGHCYNHPQQEITAIEIMVERLTTGEWPDTDAESLNARAGVGEADGRIYIEYPFTRFNGEWRLRDLSDAFHVFEPGVTQPIDLTDCFGQAWRQFSDPPFKNQGQCVSWVASGGAS